MGCVNSVAQGVIHRGDRRAGLDVSFVGLCCSRPEDSSVCLFVVGVLSDGRWSTSVLLPQVGQLYVPYPDVQYELPVERWLARETRNSGRNSPNITLSATDPIWPTARVHRSRAPGAVMSNISGPPAWTVLHVTRLTLPMDCSEIEPGLYVGSTATSEQTT